MNWLKSLIHLAVLLVIMMFVMHSCMVELARQEYPGEVRK